MTLAGEPHSTNSSSKINISQETSFTFITSTNVTGKELDFFTAAEIRLPSHSVFYFENSKISIVDTSFEGPKGNNTALMASGSVIEIIGYSFKGYVADTCAAISVAASHIIVFNC